MQMNRTLFYVFYAFVWRKERPNKREPVCMLPYKIGMNSLYTLFQSVQDPHPQHYEHCYAYYVKTLCHHS